ncbi:hypothetical protein QBC38DRAFT_444646 [Podospora fimiseda]|uniref:Uncharacterized protein n=1 Tax=Podospora fimiseda TaxID=252190 RepID=A0AAN7GXI7_9PEZI|nr:hypothetical protein QBC38DRAFT_444646 [Podospora fimiseda]
MKFSLSTLTLLSQAPLSLGAAISRATPASSPDSLLPSPTNANLNLKNLNNIDEPSVTPAPFLKLRVARADIDPLDPAAGIAVAGVANINDDDSWMPIITPPNAMPGFEPWPVVTFEPPYNSDGCGQFNSQQECDEFKKQQGIDKN